MTDSPTPEGMSAENRALMDRVFSPTFGVGRGGYVLDQRNLNRLLDAARAIPPGMCLVPLEPSEAMVDAAALATGYEGMAILIYRAMIAARSQGADSE